MKFADLHAHTCFSDGSLTPEQLVELGAQKGLSALAVTDHDTVDGVERALAHGRKIGLEVIPGLEFSSQLEGRNLVTYLTLAGDENGARVLSSLLLRLADNHFVVGTPLETRL